METRQERVGVTPFAERLRAAGDDFRRTSLDVLQVNVGKLCNQACQHCHVDAGPARTEIMTRETMDRILAFLEKSRIPVVDVTGGAPEMVPDFDHLVEGAKALGRHVIIRCNLTVIFVPGKEYLPEFYRRHAAELVCSLPCYLEENVDRQRGGGVFRQSIEALQILNRLGFGIEGSGLLLHLVYNPVGPHLPPPQEKLEADYKRELKARHGIEFNKLFTITNMPISRYVTYLQKIGQYDRYMEKLDSAFNPSTLPRLMCRNLISVGWQGDLYDCDFNQMLDMNLAGGAGPLKIWDVAPEDLINRRILTGDHCYGCAAGAGSSCGGTVMGNG